MADLTDAANPRITLAKEGIVISEAPDRLHLHLIDGSEHETDPKDPDHYQISTFEQTDIPIELPSTENKADESHPALPGCNFRWVIDREQEPPGDGQPPALRRRKGVQKSRPNRPPLDR